MSNQHQAPPKLASKLLDWFLNEEFAEEIAGDLEEKHYRLLSAGSKFKADKNYWFQVINYIRPFAIRRYNSKYSKGTIMIKNYLFVAFRNLSKHKFHTSINILSLAIGIAACLVIYLFISDEKAFDSQHSRKDNLYRLCEIQSFPGTNTQKVALSMPGMGPSFLTDFPEVKSYTRYFARRNWLWTKGDNRFKVDVTARVDSTFLKLFDFPLISGDKETVLNEPNNILVTEKLAKTIFGSVDIIGETLKLDDESFKIAGILENVPETSHMQFDIMMSMLSITRENPDFNSEFGSNYLNTYLELVPGANLASMAEKYPEYLLRNTGNEEVNDYYKLFLQPLSEVHLNSMDIEHDYHNYRKFNGSYLEIFTLVGIFIIIIAAVNFMNLTTARSSARAKEVGVRKSVGAMRNQLFWQFVTESIVLALIALLFAVIIDVISVPFLNNLIGRTLSMLSLLDSTTVILAVIGMTLFLGVIAGLYPSIYLSSFKTVQVLKGIEKSGKKSIFRSSLIVTQFSMVLAMIVATLVVLEQLNFMKSKDIGFDKDHILLVDMNETANEKFDVMKQELLKSSSVLGVTASGQRIGNNFHQWGFKAAVDTGMLEVTPSNVYVEYDYLDVYGIELVAGRGFSKEYAKDDGLAFVINESFAKELGYDEPIGQSVGHGWYPNDSLGTIIGVTKDFNFNSLHYKVNTLSMVVHTEWGYDEMSVKLSPQNLEAGITDVERIWEEMVPGYPLTYSFLDEHFEELYTSDKQMSSVISIMAVLSILIGSLGLFGLSAISVERRIKEIGIRKVLGAQHSQLLVLISKNFAWLILISFLVAAPITYYFLAEWLDSYAFRVSLNPLMFVAGGLATFIIAMLTIAYHTLKASSTNPIKSLRYE